MVSRQCHHLQSQPFIDHILAKAVKNKEINLNKVREIWQIVDSEKELLDALRDVLRFSHNTWLYPIICILRMDVSRY